MTDYYVQQLLRERKARERKERRLVIHGLFLFVFILSMFTFAVISIWTGSDFTFKAFATSAVLVMATVLKIKLTI